MHFSAPNGVRVLEERRPAADELDCMCKDESCTPKKFA